VRCREFWNQVDSTYCWYDDDEERLSELVRQLTERDWLSRTAPSTLTDPVPVHHYTGREGTPLHEPEGNPEDIWRGWKSLVGGSADAKQQLALLLHGMEAGFVLAGNTSITYATDAIRELQDMKEAEAGVLLATYGEEMRRGNQQAAAADARAVAAEARAVAAEARAAALSAELEEALRSNSRLLVAMGNPV